MPQLPPPPKRRLPRNAPAKRLKPSAWPMPQLLPPPRRRLPEERARQQAETKRLADAAAAAAAEKKAAEERARQQAETKRLADAAAAVAAEKKAAEERARQQAETKRLADAAAAAAAEKKSYPRSAPVRRRKPSASPTPLPPRRKPTTNAPVGRRRQSVSPTPPPRRRPTRWPRPSASRTSASPPRRQPRTRRDAWLRSRNPRPEDPRARRRRQLNAQERATFVKKIQEVLKRSKCYEGDVDRQQRRCPEGVNRCLKAVRQKGKDKPQRIELAKATASDFNSWLHSRRQHRGRICMPDAGPKTNTSAPPRMAKQPPVSRERRAERAPPRPQPSYSPRPSYSSGGGGGRAHPYRVYNKTMSPTHWETPSWFRGGETTVRSACRSGTTGSAASRGPGYLSALAREISTCCYLRNWQTHGRRSS